MLLNYIVLYSAKFVYVIKLDIFIFSEWRL